MEKICLEAYGSSNIFLWLAIIHAARNTFSLSFFFLALKKLLRVTRVSFDKMKCRIFVRLFNPLTPKSDY